MPSPPSSTAIQGRQRARDGNSSFNAQIAVVKSIMSRVATSTLVKVLKVTNDGGVEPVGFVDIQPLIDQVDGDGNATKHPPIYGVPYMRAQGGTNAIILDPKVGDLGLAVFASRDISGVVANRGRAVPGRGGQFRWSDALYVGGYLNGTPAQYVQFSDEGITLFSPTKVKVVAPQTDVESAVTTVSGVLSVGTGATGTFTTASGDIVTVQDGIITNIV